ncbi:MAG: hypothetical protein BroJett030_00980 [Alphaproteobacteria bacterium]|nr:MAG: hypothetical protein BroJett030_00980 [Alphaproteobacteria bacterium]
MTAPDDKPANSAISAVTGEFRDREAERRFRHDHMGETIAQARFLFGLGAVVSGVFLAANLALTEAALAPVILARGAVAAASLIGLLLVSRLAERWVQPLIIGWAGTVILASAFLQTVQPAIGEVAVFLVPALVYLVMPTMFAATVAMALAGSVVMFATHAGWDALTGAELRIAVALVLTNALFGVLKSRSGRLLRKTWCVAASHRQTLAELKTSRDMLEQTFMAVPTPLVITALDNGRIIKVNEAAEHFNGIPAAELIGRSSVEFYADPGDRAVLTNRLRAEGVVRGFRTNVRMQDGGERAVLVSAGRIGTAADATIVTNIIDITEIEKRERRLIAAKSEYQALFENSVVGIYRSTPGGKMLRANPALVRFNGYSTESELIAAVDDIAAEWYVQPGRREQWLQLMREHGRVTDFVSEVYRHRTRERVWISENSWTVYGDDGETLYFEGTLIEATDRKRAEAEYQHMASHDQLTNLANRWLLMERLQQAGAWVQRHGGRFAVLCVDLDRFKPVNDAFGHATGDLMLQEAARRLRSVCRAEDTVARIGGDEFAVLSTSFAEPRDLAVTAQRILDVLAVPFVLDGPRAVIGASIGIAIAPSDAIEAKDLLARADEALYLAKADGRNCYRFADPSLENVRMDPLPQVAAGS